MDLDFAVLCAVRGAPLDGPAAWARQAGLDESSVRRRLKRLEAQGVLQGFTAIPAAACLGRVYRNHRFRADACDVDAILAVPDVAWMARTLQGVLGVITYERGTDRRPELEALLGPHIGSYHHAGAPVDATLGRIELRVMRELIKDPRASIQTLAGRTGLGPRTVRRHRAALIDRRQIAIDPVLRTPRIPGRLFYSLMIEVTDTRYLAAVAARAGEGDAVLINHFDDPPLAYMFASSAGLVEQDELVRSIRAIPHVVDVTVVITREYAVAADRLVGWCDEAIGMWSRASREPGT